LEVPAEALRALGCALPTILQAVGPLNSGGLKLDENVVLGADKCVNNWEGGERREKTNSVMGDRGVTLVVECSGISAAVPRRYTATFQE
jgi:hypothetical protein